MPTNELWSDLHQIVISKCCRHNVLSLAHDNIGGHLGVKKTAAKVTGYLYWPSISSTVVQFRRKHHACHLAGSPIKHWPTETILVCDEPFAKFIIDCVRPLSNTK